MHTYAQTNVQLFNQLPLDVYTSKDLERVRAAYDLAACLFTGRFQASGKPFLAHLVGVASIVSALDAPPPLVAAGLIHSVYRNGEFGSGRRGMSDDKRRVVRDAVGEQVERYAARFATLPWRPASLAELHIRLDALDGLDRDVVLLRLADHLEHLLDLNVLYHGNAARRDSVKPHHDVLVDMAAHLGYPRLADELQVASTRVAAAEVPPELRGHGRPALIGPRSHRRRLALLVREQLTGRVVRWRSVIGRVQRVLTARRARHRRLSAPPA
jgi:(p)ppGpp synthase/HD superfamily hydrolase